MPGQMVLTFTLSRASSPRSTSENMNTAALLVA
ncbi:Uncharacterised protein [Mycobacteroides abscessus subsp. abscessus]|nr:Uncharacterised protein [Mycobacteroides abscessus subsp. abscessus]